MLPTWELFLWSSGLNVEPALSSCYLPRFTLFYCPYICMTSVRFRSYLVAHFLKIEDDGRLIPSFDEARMELILC